MAIKHQVHEKFKIFVGENIGHIASQIEQFTASGNVAAKSIGVEFLDKTGELLVSLGYADGQSGYRVSLKSVSLGKMDLATGLPALESAMGSAAAATKNVICQELFANASGELTMVFLTYLP